ncbi:MAG: ribbon-helix-helix protein, CopG family [Acidobacteria bacterium]|nr:ribbon-helix-helix protein, CopG family [Acidobacteriota bacterium]
MKRTTVYLPDDLKAALKMRARAERRSEAELIREAIAERVHRAAGPRPNVPLGPHVLENPLAAEHVDELLSDFGKN